MVEEKEEPEKRKEKQSQKTKRRGRGKNVLKKRRNERTGKKKKGGRGKKAEKMDERVLESVENESIGCVYDDVCKQSNPIRRLQTSALDVTNVDGTCKT